MGSSSGAKPSGYRELTREAFDQLLARLDPDRDAAGRKYDELRRKLAKFFGLWGSTSPDECADESLDRTARRIVEGEDIQNLHGFVLGVARLVQKEMVKKEIKQRSAIESLQRSLQGVPAPDQDERLPCYERCLTLLPPDDQNLFARYYQGDGRARAREREDLCRQLGITINVLRVRAFRVRKNLARCVQECVGRQIEDVMIP